MQVSLDDYISIEVKHKRRKQVKERELIIDNQVSNEATLHMIESVKGNVKS